MNMSAKEEFTGMLYYKQSYTWWINSDATFLRNQCFSENLKMKTLFYKYYNERFDW